jgi:hypothetical protein
MEIGIISKLFRLKIFFELLTKIRQYNEEIFLLYFQLKELDPECLLLTFKEFVQKVKIAFRHPSQLMPWPPLA